MLVTPVRQTYYELFKECAQSHHVKFAAAVAAVFATSFVPIYFLPTFSKATQIAIIAGASAGWGIFFSYRYQPPPESIVLA